jgi:hypothetical protein
MKEKRAPKGWTFISTNEPENTETEHSRNRREENFRKAIRNTKSLKEFDLKKESEKLAEANKIADAQLLAAFEDKKLKSKALIKKAQQLKKKAKKEKSASADMDKIEVVEAEV